MEIKEKLIINKTGYYTKDQGFTKVEKWNPERTTRLAELYKEILELIGENPAREGLVRTPLRIGKSIQFLTQGYNIDPEQIVKGALFREDYNQMVIVKDIDIYSLCEHHMLPFFGKAHVAYIPDGYITGLSKIARVVEAYSRRLQVQERLTNEIKTCLHETLKPLGVAVVIEAQHMCMQIRGIQKQNSVTTTSAFTGEFMDNIKTREEFIHLIASKLH